MKRNNYKYIGDLNAAPSEYGMYLYCDECRVEWIGCWDNSRCPQCDNSDAWEKLMEERGYYKKPQESDRFDRRGVT